jgi:diacylglycerol O-acyltransferase / wax synthase
MAGAPVRSIFGWVPTSADQPLGVCLFSYNGSLTVGVSTDARMIPDPDHFVDLVEHHLGELSQVADTPKGPGGERRTRPR